MLKSSSTEAPICASDFSEIEDKTTNLIYLSKIVKSWAIGLDIAIQLKSSGHQVIVLDGTHTNFLLRLPSLKRIAFSRNTLREYSIPRLKVNLPLNLLLFVRNLKKSRSAIRSQFKSLDREKSLILAHFAHRSGTSVVNLEKLSYLSLFFVTYRVLALQNIVEKVLEKYDSSVTSVYVFNGREISDSPVISVARKFNYATRVIERASSSDRFEVYFESPHTNNEWWRKIQQFQKILQISDLEVNNELVRKYVAQRMGGYDPFENRKWKHFLTDKISNVSVLEDPFICFFSVSTGEYSPIPEFDSIGGYENQFKALDDLLDIASRLGFKIVIRRHPNSLGKDGIDREDLLWKIYESHKNVIYFSPRSKIDSYELARKSLACFTWRSTIGFDTLAWNIPTFAMGPAKWAIDKSVRAWNIEDLKLIFNNPFDSFQNSSQREDVVRKYATYMTHFGFPLKVFKIVERWGVLTFESQKIRGYLFQRLIGLPRR